MHFVDTKFVPKDITIAAKVQSWGTMYKIWFCPQECGKILEGAWLVVPSEEASGQINSTKYFTY